MLGTSFTRPVAHDELRHITTYLTDDTWLFRKYVEAKYNEDIPKFNAQLSNDVATFKDLMPPGNRAATVRERSLAPGFSAPITHFVGGGAQRGAGPRGSRLGQSAT